MNLFPPQTAKRGKGSKICSIANMTLNCKLSVWYIKPAFFESKSSNYATCASPRRDVIKINKPEAAKAARVLTTDIALVSAASYITAYYNPKATHSRKIRQLLDAHRILVIIIIQVSEMSKQHLKLQIFLQEITRKL